MVVYSNVLTGDFPPDFPAGLRPIVVRFLAGEVSGPVALMQAILAHPDARAISTAVEKLAREMPRCKALLELAQLAAQHACDLANTSALVRSGVMDLPDAHPDAVALIGNRFDAAVEMAPEASVALYSLGSPELLEQATAEIVSRMDEWKLVSPATVVLDIGCGIGRLERALAPRIARIIGIDISCGMLAEAKRRCGDLPNVRFDVCNGRDLANFSDACVDLVVAIDSLPYLFAADPALVARHVKDARALLKRGGALLILNFSYRGDRDADMADVNRLALENGFTVKRAGERDFQLWDGLTYLLTA
jgi:SAM-dependent methyltransferase